MAHSKQRYGVHAAMWTRVAKAEVERLRGAAEVAELPRGAIQTTSKVAERINWRHFLGVGLPCFFKVGCVLSAFSVYWSATQSQVLSAGPRLFCDENFEGRRRHTVVLLPACRGSPVLELFTVARSWEGAGRACLALV